MHVCNRNVPVVRVNERRSSKAHGPLCSVFLCANLRDHEKVVYGHLMLWHLNLLYTDI